MSARWEAASANEPAPAANAAPPRRVRRLVVETGAGERLDRYLAERLDVPRNRVQRWAEPRKVL